MMRPITIGFALLFALTVAAATEIATDGSKGSAPNPESNVALPAEPSSAADSQPLHSAETDRLLDESETHVQAGRQLCFKGDLVGARRQFDQAVDVLLTAPDSLPDHRRIERRLDEVCDLIYRFDLEKLGAGQSEDEVASFDKAPIDEISHMTFSVDPALAPKLQSELSQTSSGIPLELTDPVLGFVHYFSTETGRRILLAGLRRSGRYRPMIERVLAEEGMPQELIYLAQAESGFLPRAISYKAATGMWQFIAETGSIYNLARTRAYDERFDPEKATRAAARYLKDLYARYGDWYLAMAAYNCGAGAVDRAVERTGYADYWELLKRHALPRQTANYVPIIVAMTIVAKNAKDYGLENVEIDPPLAFDTAELSAPTNLNLIADATMQPLSVIRDLNPSLLTMVAPAGFQIHLPKGTAPEAQASIESVPAANRQAWRLHRVEAGDTLATIARSYHLTPERIVAVNGQTGALEAGDTLLIPAVYHPETPRTSRARARSKSASRKSNLAKMRSSHPTAARRGTHLATSLRVSSPVPLRNSSLPAASLSR